MSRLDRITPKHAAPVAPDPNPGPDVSEQFDALAACLRHAARLLGCPLGQAALDAARGPDGDRSAAIMSVVAAAEQAGLQAGFGAWPLSGFDDTLTPAILILHDGRAVVLERIGRDSHLVIHDPALRLDTGEIAQARLARAYSGYAIVLRRAHTPDRDSGPEGHWFGAALAANRWSYAQVVLAAVLANVLGLATSVFIMAVYDRVLPNEAVDSLIALTTGVALALLFDFAVKTLRAGFIDRAGERADRMVGRRIFDQVVDLRMSARGGSTGALASTLRDFETLRDFFTSATLVAIVDLPFVVLFIGVIFLVGGPLALIPALVVPLVLIVGLGVQPFLRRRADGKLAEGQGKQSVLVETLAGIETVKATGAAPVMRARWEEAVARQSQHGARARMLTQFAMNVTGFAQQGAQVLIVFCGVFLVTGGSVSMGALIACVILTGRALAPLAQLSQTLARLAEARAAYRNLDRLMRGDRDRPPGRRWMDRPRLDGGISLTDVDFAYGPQGAQDQGGSGQGRSGQGRQALCGVTLSIAPGERVAILGRAGSGKSTLARLILGLYTPDRGAVRIDRTDIAQIDPGDLRRNIGAVLQDVWLFSGTVRDNIAIGHPRASDSDILRAARVAGADAFIASHPDGYEQELTERGGGLSGGQQQAIALARALIGQPPVLLLDEPTSAMDIETEAAVIARLRTEAAGRTLILVTHRPALLDLVDRVIVLEGGRVAFDGDRAGLIERATSGGAQHGR